MASADRHSAEFKIEVAREALERDNKELEPLSRKYSIPVSLILTWAVQLEKRGPESFSDDEGYGTQPRESESDTFEVDISDSDIAASVDRGAMSDDLNYKRLTFWGVLGLILFIVFVQGLMEMFKSNRQMMRERVSSQSEYYQANQLRDEAEDRLSRYGVVNPEEGSYHVPIDSVINEMTEGN